LALGGGIDIVQFQLWPSSLEESIDAEAAIVSSTAATLFSSVFRGFAGPAIKFGLLSAGSGQVSVGSSPSASFSGDLSQAWKPGSGSTLSSVLLGAAAPESRDVGGWGTSVSIEFQANIEVFSEDEGCEVDRIDC